MSDTIKPAPVCDLAATLAELRTRKARLTVQIAIVDRLLAMKARNPRRE